MDGATAVTEILTDHEGIDDPLNAYYTGLRQEIARDFNRASDWLWVYYNWPWKTTTTTIPISAGVGLTLGAGTLPANFQAFGHQMTVTINGIQRPPLAWKPLGDLLRARAARASTVAYPWNFSIGDETLGVKTLLVAPYVSQVINLDLRYDKNPPTITDSTSPSGMEDWPIACHRAVLYEMVVQARMRKKGDVRSATEQGNVVRAAIANFVRSEMPGRGEQQRMPPHPAARGWYRKAR